MNGDSPEASGRRAARRRGRLALLLAPVLALFGPLPGAAAAPPARAPSLVPVPGNEEAWKHLPPAVKGAGQLLPPWARALAPSLPSTTAAMLELDLRHRTHGPLEPKLRAKMRWVVARANGCASAEDCAAADLLRAGGSAADLRALADSPAALPEGERAALAFARTLTLAPTRLTDDEVARLVKRHGEGQVVAMALLVAHANFQDRLLLALDLPPDAGRPLPPVEVRFRRPPLGADLARPRPKPPARPAPAPPRAADGDWLALDAFSLRREMDKQRSQRPRVGLPSGGADGVLWGQVCRGYQPELAAAWSACTKAFGAEAKLDPVLEASVFWVVTRTQRSFY